MIKCNYHLGEGNPRKDKWRVAFRRDERQYTPYTAQTPNKKGARMAGRGMTNCPKFTVSKRALLKDPKVADKLRFLGVSYRRLGCRTSE